MANKLIKCWICGDTANSGEHMVKQTDFKQVFNIVNQQEPIISRENGEIKNRNIQSCKSNHLKFKNEICEKCNNQLTQPYDRSWEKLSAYLHTNWTEIKIKKKFNLREIFGDNFKQDILNVHLFFVKILGCIVEEEKSREHEEESVIIDTKQLAKSILENIECDNIYISFRDTKYNKSKEYVGLYLDQNYNENYVFVLYMIGDIIVNIIFSKVNNKKALNNAQKPSEIKEIINLVEYVGIDE